MGEAANDEARKAEGIAAGDAVRVQLAVGR
jgi:hypothetical protein